MKKKHDSELDDDLREEYDLSKMQGLVRGKYIERLKGGSNIVVLAPDVVEAFPNSDAVNEALRLLMNVAKCASKKQAA